MVNPATEGTILEGIMRKSITEIALDLGYKVSSHLHLCSTKIVSIPESKQRILCFCSIWKETTAHTHWIVSVFFI